MADSSINDPEARSAAGEDTAPLPEPPAGPPRPPRPAKRTSGPVRIPLPSSVIPGSKLNGSVRAPSPPNTPAPANSNAIAIAELDAATEMATATATPVPAARISTRPPAAVVTPAVPGDNTANYEFALTRRSSGAPPMSFDSQDVDPSDRAPAAPFTPWRDVPPLQEPELARAPAQPSEDEHEDTMVGEVPKNLLEMSSEDDENTRAYQAPQELIDLARREREVRRQAAAASGQTRKASDSLLPAGRLSGIAPSPEDLDQNEISTATVPIDATPPSDAAPPVAHSGPARAVVSDEPIARTRSTASGASLAELARAVSDRAESDAALSEAADSVPADSEVVSGEAAPDSDEPSLSNYESSWLTPGRIWVLLVGLFLIVGFALARWRGLDLLLPR